LTPEQYDAWYGTPRGAWIGEIEYRLLRGLLQPGPAASLIDVGCGTGYFTRRFALDGQRVTGVDPDSRMLAFARAHSAADERYLPGDMRALPFRDREFDCCVSVAALCFVGEEAAALREMVRVTRKRLVLGLLNRHSLLHLQKGLRGGSGAYRGARWHKGSEVRDLCASLALPVPEIRYGVFLPAGGATARAFEALAPRQLPLGAFLAVSLDLL
jgi:SAM-dependent methyltransferase